MSVDIVNSGKPLTDADIDAAEKRWKRTIPPAYRRFLLAHNGGSPARPVSYQIPQQGGQSLLGSIDFFLGIGESDAISLDYFVRRYHDRIPSDLFPVARDGGGNVVCIGTAGEREGQVFFWDHEEEAEEGDPPTYDNIYPLANSFEEFLDNLNEDN